MAAKVGAMAQPVETGQERTRTVTWDDPLAGVRKAEGLTGLE